MTARAGNLVGISQPRVLMRNRSLAGHLGMVVAFATRRFGIRSVTRTARRRQDFRFRVWCRCGPSTSAGWRVGTLSLRLHAARPDVKMSLTTPLSVKVVLTCGEPRFGAQARDHGRRHRPRVGNAIRLVEYEYAGHERLLVIGADRQGRLLGLVAVPAGEPTRIIHADLLRPKFYDYLR